MINILYNIYLIWTSGASRHWYWKSKSAEGASTKAFLSHSRCEQDSVESEYCEDFEEVSASDASYATCQQK